MANLRLGAPSLVLSWVSKRGWSNHALIDQRKSVSNCSSAIFRDLSFVCLIQTGHTTGPRHYRVRSVRNFSTRHCSLHPTPHINQYRQAAACQRAAQQKRRTYRSLRSPQWQSWYRRQAQLTLQIELHSDACAISTRPLTRRALLVARGPLSKGAFEITIRFPNPPDFLTKP